MELLGRSLAESIETKLGEFGLGWDKARQEDQRLAAGCGRFSKVAERSSQFKAFDFVLRW